MITGTLVVTVRAVTTHASRHRATTEERVRTSTPTPTNAVAQAVIFKHEQPL